ncbi:MAG: hypothetical protein ACQEVT_03485 [Pseudomonadota bacterium]|uniref:hypothetical protein n=1 Tax=Roseovarius TaxID=74030 RepID=UPI0022A73CA0|nr:hypothetical protein [Roseovarius sp. EGI FJ00037]MCZ0811515.1 hypothetical protein [Roseovarius sp. EGI FJ00037]
MTQQSQTAKTTAEEALTLLEQAWAYYDDEVLPVTAGPADDEGLFQYHRAA